MELIDLAIYLIASKTFTSTALSRAHASNSFNKLPWYGIQMLNPINSSTHQAQPAEAVNLARVKRLRTYSHAHHDPEHTMNTARK